jgi:AmmeMemoRadiSam system protein B
MQVMHRVRDMPEYNVRPAMYADDRWYPAAADALRQEVTAYMERAPVLDLPGQVIGLIAPHAGYFFSGHVSGASYRQVRGQTYDAVVLVGPDHHGVTYGRLSIPDFDAWHTPLGDVAVDPELVTAMEAQLPVRHIARDNEHSLEIQLPFLQAAVADFTLLPLLMGDQSPEACRNLGRAIADAVGERRALLVASTDLSHYHTYQEAARLDRRTLQYVLDFDPTGLAEALEHDQAHACGGGPVAATMFAAQAQGATQAHLVKYANSGDVWDDKSRVVGYAAAVFTH